MAGEPLVTITGNLVADPEARVSQAGKSWVTFRIASTPRVRDRQSGEWSDGEALWFGCRAYGDMADHIAASLKKGMRVIVEGLLTQRTYEQNGQQRTSLDLEVQECGPSLRFATTSVSRGGSGGPAGGGYAPPPTTQGRQYGSTPGGGYAPPPGGSAWGTPPPAGQQPASTPAASNGFDDEQPF